MNLWSADSIIDVFKNLVAGLASQWIPQGCRWRTPNGSSISAARQRVGSRVMTRLFEKLARPKRNFSDSRGISQWVAVDGN